VRWSVGIEAAGDRVFSREEVVELADAVAASSGVATGIGTSRYGARLLVVAAGLPDAPIVRTEAISEAEAEAAEDAEDEGAGIEEASGLR
jgi:hypothetical protein